MSDERWLHILDFDFITFLNVIEDNRAAFKWSLAWDLLAISPLCPARNTFNIIVAVSLAAAAPWFACPRRLKQQEYLSLKSLTMCDTKLGLSFMQEPGEHDISVRDLITRKIRGPLGVPLIETLNLQ